MKTINQIAQEIKDYIGSWNKPFNVWYFGISSEPNKRVFEVHGVRKDNGYGWIIRECQSSNDARKLEEYFTKTLGTEGDLGGGDLDSNFVYAYQITNYTKENV